MSNAIIEKVVAEMKTLPEHLQEEVLQFLEGLKQNRPIGVPGRSLRKFIGAIPEKDLEEMETAINEGCSQVDLDGW